MKPLYSIGWSLSWILSHLLLRIEVIDREYVPKKGSFLLACNHKSVTDPPILGSTVGREMHFMAKKELFKNRFFGGLISRVNAHPVNRHGFDKSAIDSALKILANDEAMVMFPEGTRALKGAFLKPHPGIGLVARTAVVPVVPAYIHGTDNLSGCFWGREKLGVIFGEPIDSGEIAAYSKDKEGYRRLAADIMNRIKDLQNEFFRRTKHPKLPEDKVE